MLALGTLSLGEPCAPYSLSHLKVVDGQVVTTSWSLMAEGCAHPLDMQNLENIG